MEQLANDWQADDAACEAYRAREHERLVAWDARRRHELQHGAAYEWAWNGCVLQLLSRKELAGNRSMYGWRNNGWLRPFSGSVDEAEQHLPWYEPPGDEASDQESDDDQEPDDGLTAEEREEHRQRRAAAAVWMQEQRRVLEQEQAAQLRWDSVHGEPHRGMSKCFIKLLEPDETGAATTVVHAGAPSSGALLGGYAIGAPIVRGGVHEFTLTLDASPSRPPRLGVCGERKAGPSSRARWVCALDLSDGRLYYDDEQLHDQPPLPITINTASRPLCKVVVRVHFEQQNLAFSVDDAPMVWVTNEQLRYVGVGFVPFSAQPYVEMHRVHSTGGGKIPMPVSEGTAVTIADHACLLAAPDVIAPAPPPGPRLVMAIDPDGDVPYYYYSDDMARALAQRYGCLDTSVDSPDWHTAPSQAAGPSIARPEPPPRRSQYPTGTAGRERFRSDRAQWYFERTGKQLQDKGNVAQQNAAFDLLARNFRAGPYRQTIVNFI